MRAISLRLPDDLLAELAHGEDALAHPLVTSNRAASAAARMFARFTGKILP